MPRGVNWNGKDKGQGAHEGAIAVVQARAEEDGGKEKKHFPGGVDRIQDPISSLTNLQQKN